MTAKPHLFPLVGRLLVYAVLVLASVFFLLPLYAMLVTSFKDAQEIRASSLLALPHSLNAAAWSTAWSSACTGVDCQGLRPFFWNSVWMVVPAVAISTVWGALNGYVLSLWKFRGSDTLFGLLLFGVFMPYQVVLLPMSQVLGWLGLSSSIAGLVLVHCLAGLAGTTLFFRNYYAAIPNELVNAARMDGAGFWQIFWRIVLPLSMPIVMVALIWQFTNIWNDFLFGVVFSGTESKPITVGLNNLANTSSSVKAYNVDMAAAHRRGLDRQRADDPVRDVEIVHVLLDDVVTREPGEVEPVAQLPLGVTPLRLAGEVPERPLVPVHLRRDDFADGAVVNALDRLDVPWIVATLRPADDRQMLRGRGLRRLDDRQRAGHVSTCPRTFSPG